MATANNIGNAIDRDKSMAGMQLIPGGFRGGIERVKNTNLQQEAQQDFGPQSNLYQNINKIFQTPLPKPVSSGLNFLNKKVIDPLENTAVGTILNPKAVGERMANQAAYTGNLMKARQEKINSGQKPSLGEELNTGINTVATLLPGIDDIVMGAYDYAKAKGAKLNPQETFAGSPDVGGGNYVGLGSAVTGNKEGLVADLLNVAELPLIIAGGLKAGGMKNVNQSLKNVGNTADNINPKAVVNSIDNLLTRPSSVTFTQAKNLLKQGDTLDDITEIAVKNANEARQATRLGIPANKLKIGGSVDDIFEPGPSMYGSKTGDVLTELPKNQQAFEFAQEAKNVSLDVGNKVTNFTRKLFLDTKDNLKKTFGPLYDTYLAPVMDKFTQQMGDGARWAQGYYKKLDELGIKPGSKDDKLIRQFQNKDGFAKVASQVGQEKARQLQGAYNTLRQFYDEIYNFINTQRKAAGLSEIPYHGNDFLSQISSKGKSIFEATLEGGVQTTEAISKAISKKQGAKATTGAIESMRDYLGYAQRAGFTDLTAKELADFRLALSQNKGIPEQALQQLQKIENNILGIKDKQPFLEGVTKVIDTLSGAKVLGKASALLNQLLALPQGVAATGRSFFKGIGSKEAEQALKQSNFITAIKNRPPRSLRSGGIYNKYKGLLGDLLAGGQDFSNSLIFKGFFEQARSAGKSFDEAVKIADDLTPKIVGDRRLAMSPEIYSSYFGNIFGRFTIEPTAAVTRLVDSIGQKKALEVVGTLMSWHLMNDIMEDRVYGYRPFPVDPVEWVEDFMENYQGSDKKEKSKIKAFAGLFANALASVPIASNVFNTAYSIGETTGALPDSRKVFGSADQTWMNVGGLLNPFENYDRPITGNAVADAGLNITANLVPGLDQLLKTTQAGQSLNRKYAETKAGDPMYQMPTDLLGMGRALTFGQSATNQAQDWFDNDFAPWLTDTQKKALEKLPEDQRLDYLKNVQSKNEQLNKLKYMNRQVGEGNALSNKEINTLFKNQAKPDQTNQVDRSIDSIFTKPTSKNEEDENRSLYYEMLNAGMPISDKDTQLVLFNGKTANSTNINDRIEVFKTLKSIMRDEYLSDAQKQAIIKASGANENQVEFYTFASKTNDEKLQELLPSLGDLSTPENFKSLLTMRAKIAGQQGLTPGMIDYLYQNDYIGKDQRDLLKAIDFDEVTQKFFIKKSSKYGADGSGSKKLTYSQLLKLFSIDLKELNSSPTKSSDNYVLFKDPGLIENILNSKV